MNQAHSDRIAVVATIDPDVYTTGAQTSDYVDMSKFDSAQAIVLAGALATTLDAKLVQATSATGAGSKDITSASITQMTATGSDDTQAVINVKAADLDVANSFRYIAMTMTVGAGSNDCGGLIIAAGARNAPASDNDLSSVAEIVNF